MTAQSLGESFYLPQEAEFRLRQSIGAMNGHLHRHLDGSVVQRGVPQDERRFHFAAFNPQSRDLGVCVRSLGDHYDLSSISAAIISPSLGITLCFSGWDWERRAFDLQTLNLSGDGVEISKSYNERITAKGNIPEDLATRMNDAAVALDYLFDPRSSDVVAFDPLEQLALKVEPAFTFKELADVERYGNWERWVSLEGEVPERSLENTARAAVYFSNALEIASKLKRFGELDTMNSQTTGS